MFYPYGANETARTPRFKQRQADRQASWGRQDAAFQQHAYPYEAYQNTVPYQQQTLYQYQPVTPTIPYMQNLAQFTPNTAFQPQPGYQQQPPYPYPYPKNGPFQPQQSNGMQTMLSQFKKPNGQYDYNKMMDTAGQMMSAVNQMSSLFKGVTGFLK
ncbi:spore coat protein [Bacillus mangrovi]|uniref:Spore coat protein n=1 Tax=Metabacillus mangrovi TaxID=1491830 RepID=A0A7X2V3I7_9BACI|nr:YppG family protein [Metabacillus mangrovi]MTH52124.1 spore coat protein [Metabacillus mangrovi]